MRPLRAVLFCVFIFLGLATATWKLIIRNPSIQLFGELHSRGKTGKKQVALTFDDGPNPANTLPLLQLLEASRTPATFFMIGENIEKHPDVAKRVLIKGHQIANHSYSHRRMIFSSREFCKKEIERTDRLMRSLGFEGEIFFRPPFGKKFITLPLVLQQLGKISITWDAESEDTETQNGKILTANVLRRVKAGSIILFHDGGAAKPGTYAAVDEVIKTLKGEGYSFVTVATLMGGQ